MKKMDVIKFKLSDYDWFRVIPVINGTKVSKFAHRAERKKDYDTFGESEEYSRVYSQREYYRYGDGIYPGWLYYELKGGLYHHPGYSKIYNFVEPFIPYVTREGKIHVSNLDDDKIKSASILGCTCSDGCDQYTVRITETENSVIWDDYFALKFNRPNYFHFEFEKKQYFKEVEKLIDLTLKIGVSEGLPREKICDIKINGEQIDLSVFEKQFLQQKKHFKFY